jgi:hypothetical protein
MDFYAVRMAVYACKEFFQHLLLQKECGQVTTTNDRASYRARDYSMKVQVRITRTDTGANTRVKSDTNEVSKDYDSWDDALAEANQIELVSAVEAVAAKLLPPGMPFHTTAEVDASVFSMAGFVSGKQSPPQ